MVLLNQNHITLFSLYEEEINSDFTRLCEWFYPTICHKSLASQFKSYLNSHFKVEDLGAPKILPLAGSCTKDQGISICQRKYASEFLEDTDLVPSQLSSYGAKSKANQ